MTIAGKVFRAYVEEIIAVHGFGSNKMVKMESPKFIKHEMMKANDAWMAFRSINSRTECDMNEWNEAKAKSDAAMKHADEITDSHKMLSENGYIRIYQANWDTCSRSGARVGHIGIYIGLTKKGWAVANKYLNAKE